MVLPKKKHKKRLEALETTISNGLTVSLGQICGHFMATSQPQSRLNPLTSPVA